MWAVILEWLKNLSGPLGLGGLLLYFVRDYRKNRVDVELAEKTLPSSVRVRDAEGDQATLVTIERAFALERDSRERTIHALQAEVNTLRVDVQDKNETIRVQGETIEGLRGQVAELGGKLSEITRQFHQLRQDLEQAQAITE